VEAVIAVCLVLAIFASQRGDGLPAIGGEREAKREKGGRSPPFRALFYVSAHYA
jgi:hypothetical protein